ncbi:hypothetical protein F4808DRAFT_418078 [Astrocystis sublimbata]|nr:hypothetical protein F4808DRAFT_418078 [Astrocystis sublimbata]
MLYTNILLGLIWAGSARARYTSRNVQESRSIDHGSSVNDAVTARDQLSARDTYPINCHIHDWPSASVESIKGIYDWFYQLWAPFEADAQQCRRIACQGTSAVWMCADSLDYQNINSVRIADKMNDLLDGDHGCLDKDNKDLVQGMVFTTESWNIVVRGGEDCSVDVPEQPIFY